ncbi:MAG: hypothetical protein A2832_00575 [Candidatus Zambryskibacteria bacterium RIFCSPHIGHO2_01_FULL_44_22b]|uniref:Peptidase M16 n=2 Tax=Candidatus Zambryskiibacteriota TaxID=1817925 RepID=A0A1G2T4G6_9BACT|nr:MAG: hypothetical protein A2832_00575 [Candidatus Zambryskibacteria bacterium RIFCSPHIGHO2_01_FULL_44_22b]OHB06381.1 MAG: hypothetical protein A3B16_00250 [Candidatus Zambryskibacteria bacterium RIFCSPLOWO2_01_FULL_45_43]
MNFKKTTLPNGLRVITVPAKGNPSVTVMVLVETGSNYESKEENGLSHFLEHMCFKGTTNRHTSREISMELDSLGAENNAFTSHEMTGYWAKAEKKHFGKILEVVSDIYLNPTLPAPDLEKERGVILQEISMYEDRPQSKVWQELGTLLYGDTPAGRPVAGEPENIKKLSREAFINYRTAHYIAPKTIVIVAGDVNEKKALQEIKKHFKNIPTGKKIGKLPVKEKQVAPGMRIYKKKTDQTHMVIAFRAFHAGDKRAPALHMLSSVLGEGMSSRLFQKMREEMGACYYVRSGIEEYTDHGTFSISTGIEAKRAEEVVKALLEECEKLRDSLVPEEELNKAKEHFIGQMYMHLETSDSMAEFYADEVITAKELKTPIELEKEARQVTAEDIRRVAREIFKNDNLNLAIVGNISNVNGLKKVLSLKQS